MTFSPLRFEPLPPGTAGAVSWPGLLAAVAGAALVAVAARTMGLVAMPLAWAVAIAGFLGSLAESAVNDFARRQGWRFKRHRSPG